MASCTHLALSKANLGSNDVSATLSSSLWGHQVAGMRLAWNRRQQSGQTITTTMCMAGEGGVDRRELLTGASATGLSLLYAPGALADPVTPPDLTKCMPAQVSTTTVSCCLPVSAQTAKPYRPDPSVKKVRRPAHLVSAAYKDKYNKAYELMRALPTDDPRSFKQQADVHCAFCNGAYPTTQNESAELQIHFNWLFLPWHRYYLFFHERILGSLINDPTFALPYWNWDDQKYGGNVIPAMFVKKDKYPGLYDKERNQDHLPPVINTLSLADSSSNLTNEQIIANNLNVMYQSVVAASTASLFMGQAPLFGSITDNTAAGSLESGPHTAIHVFAGNPNNTYREDMGNFYSAGRDPLFYSHHANVDRMWVIWNNIGGRRKDHTSQDFLISSFVFYNEQGELVEVSVKDCINSYKQLGVEYERAPGDKLWLGNLVPPKGKKGVVPEKVGKFAEFGPAATGKKPQKAAVGTTIKSLVSRPLTSKAEYGKANSLTQDEVEEVLVLQDVKVPKTTVTHLVVFINLEDADASTPLNVAEFVGQFANVPHLGSMAGMTSRQLNVRFGISDNLKRLGLEDQTKLGVTVVVKEADPNADPVTIGGFAIEYD